MRKRNLIPIVILASIAFNIGFVFFIGQGEGGIHWPFVDLGPAVIQDSFFVRAPGLESPYGMIGDVPGGYSLYTGNPLQSESSVNLTGILGIPDEWVFTFQHYDAGIILVAVLFAVAPLSIIIILGRRSYGSTKTQ